MSETATAPWPLVTLPVAPHIGSEWGRLLTALRVLAAEDKSLHVSGETPAEIQLGGLSEDHLDASIDALRRNHGVEVTCGPPTVAFRETIARPMDLEYRHRIGQGFVSLTFCVHPVAGLSVSIRGGEGALGTDGAAALRKGIEQVLGKGLRWGFPVVGIAISAVPAEGCADLATLRRVGEIATRQAIEQGGVVLLEPILAATVTVPNAHAEMVVADLATRRGEVLARRDDGEVSVVEMHVPLVNLFGYRNSLRELSGGLGTFTSRFACYRPAPFQIDNDPSPAAAMALRA
jgi:elongation factor G